MPVTLTEAGHRQVVMELIVPGTPEQVWRAIATGPGNTAWFTKTSLEERVGGALRFDMGVNGESVGQVTVWEPPRRFAYVERDWSPGAPPVATEITVQGRAGHQCVIRMVHSLFATTDDWDDQLEGFEQGWPAFFEVLRLHLSHFAGQAVVPVTAQVASEGGNLAAWHRLLDGLALRGADAGEVRAATATPEPFSGRVERIAQSPTNRVLHVRLDAPAPGVAMVAAYDIGAKTYATLTLYLTGVASVPDTHERQSRWQSWLDARGA